MFDGDDTLWKTQELYDAVKSSFAELLRDRGFRATNPVVLLDHIDAEAAHVRGFTVQRFVDSMLQTYRLLASQEVRSPQPRDEEAIRELAKPVFGTYVLYDDAVETLELLSRTFRLVLATKGEANLQTQKIAQLNLNRYFKRIHIVERKTREMYESILAEADATASQSWAVGNSVRSDINPARKAGMQAVWIRRPSWLFEEEAMIDDAVLRVNTLSQAGAVMLASHGRREDRTAG